jgi:hypothetical protein
MNPLENCKPYIFRAQGGSDGLPDGIAYCFEIVIGGSSSYHLAARNMDGEDLAKVSPRFYDARWRQYMAIVALTDEQISSASSRFGKFSDGKFVGLSDPLGNV